MKELLVPIDFSVEAYNALGLAHQIAEKTGARLKLINIVEFIYPPQMVTMGPEVSNYMDSKFMKEIIENVTTKMEKIVNDPKFGNIEISYEVEVGSPLTSIGAEIAKNKVDLVVMGSKGASGIEETLVGSNTEKVVRKAKCPVLVVKSSVKLEEINNIVFATKFTEKQDNVIRELKRFQEITNSKIHLLKINPFKDNEGEEEAMKYMDEFAKNNVLQNFTLNYRKDDVEEEGIIRFAEEINAQMIAMATHGRTGISHLIFGSLTEKIVNHARRPIWTCSLKI